MRTLIRKFATATVVASAAALAPLPVLAQEAAPKSPNAALYYWRAWQQMPKELDQSAAENYKSGDADWRPDEALTKLLKENQGFIGSVLRATRIEDCDFEVAYDDGFTALMPHLGIMRKTTRVLGADARRLMAAGEGDAAVERIASMFRLASHTRSDRVLISSLVGMAIFSTAMSEVEVFSKAGGLTEQGRTALLTELLRLDSADPFATREALETEREMALVSVKRECTGPDAGQQFVKLLSSFQDEVPNAEEIRAMDEAAFNRAVDRTSDFYLEAAAVWDLPDAGERLEKLVKQLEDGEFGPVAQVLTPSIAKCHESCVRSRAKLAATINLLKGTPPTPAEPTPAK